MKKRNRGSSLSALCLLLAAGGFLANMAKSKSDEEAAREEMREEVRKEVQAQLGSDE